MKYLKHVLILMDGKMNMELAVLITNNKINVLVILCVVALGVNVCNVHI